MQLLLLLSNVLGVMIPELVEMQTRALIEAALNNKYLKGLNPIIEIMIPLVSSSEEFSHQKQLITNIHKLILSERPGQNIDLKIGTMIEIPRAALIAPDIVKAGAEFFSYGIKYQSIYSMIINYINNKIS